MPILHAIVLALVQGLTEFLPISSSAHLILVPWLVGWEDQGLTFDVVLHLGSLTAVCAYYRTDLLRIAAAWLDAVRGRAPADPADARMGWFLIVATVPGGLAGVTFSDQVETVARSPLVIGVASIAFGLLLWAIDRYGRRTRAIREMGWRDALAVGLAQALALIPGTSRSGITMTAGLAMGLTREASAHFSFLLSIPIIIASGVFKVAGLVEQGIGEAQWAPLLLGYGVSAASAYLCIKYLLIYLQRHSMGVFVAYRVALGAIILAALA